MKSKGMQLQVVSTATMTDPTTGKSGVLCQGQP